MTALIKFTIYNLRSLDRKLRLQFTIKLLLILLTFISTFYILHSTFLKPAFATSPTSTPAVAMNSQLPSYVPPTSPLYTDLIVSNMFHTFACLAVGQSPIGQPCLTYKMTQNAQGILQGVPILSQTNLSGGVLGATTNIIGLLYLNPPVRTADYLASLGKGFGIIKTANAQVGGSGANILNPILQLWQVSRNISYIIMIIIFLVIGLMVMFRNKLNPQTVITAQTALPGLVIGLILITFSYFMAGLVSDTAFIGINVVGYYFSAAQPGNTPTLTQKIATESVLTIFGKFMGIFSQGDIASALASVFDNMTGEVQTWIRLFAGLIGYQVGSQFGAPLGAIGGGLGCTATIVGAELAPICAVLAGLIGPIVGGIVFAIPAAANPTGTFGLVLYFVAVAVLIYSMLKLLLKLINNYLTIIFLTITAPFQFLAASLPGRQGIVTGWILSMLCNVLAFPAVFAVFYFVAFLWGPSTDTAKLFGIITSQNIAGNQTFPLFGGLNISFIRLMLAFGALLATPAIPDLICRAVGKANQAGQIIGQEISGSTRSGQGYAGQMGSRVGNITGSLGKSMGGETQYRWDEETKSWIPYTGSPGFLGKRGIGNQIGPTIGRIRSRI